MTIINKYILFLVLFVSFYSCKDESNNSDIKKTSEPTIAIDTASFKVEKNNYKIESVLKDFAPSSQSEVEALIKGNKQLNLDQHEVFVQEFFVAIASKKYENASKYLAYRGSDTNRNNKVSYNTSNLKEMSVVKTTVDVVFDFLAESNNFKFSNSKEKQTKVGKVQNVEVTFFKKGMGISRHYFDVIDTNKGMLIYNMK